LSHHEEHEDHEGMIADIDKRFGFFVSFVLFVVETAKLGLSI
jgi:hypothetical protein